MRTHHVAPRVQHPGVDPLGVQPGLAEARGDVLGEPRIGMNGTARRVELRIENLRPRQAPRRLRLPRLVIAGKDRVAAFALDGVDDPGDRHAAGIGEGLLPLAADEQNIIDRLRNEQHRRDGKHELADETAGPEPQFHAAPPSRLTSHASV